MSKLDLKANSPEQAESKQTTAILDKYLSFFIIAKFSSFGAITFINNALASLDVRASFVNRRAAP